MTGVWIRWTGMVEWIGGLDWTEMEWNGMENARYKVNVSGCG